MINFLILTLILLVLAYLINYFLVRSFFGYKWRFFVAPGVIIHELSHAFACLICGAKIVKISFFDKEGGSVHHQKPIIPIFGPIFISIAPLVVSILIFYFLAQYIKLESSLNLTAIVSNFKMIFSVVNFSHWQNLLVVYLLLSIAVTMTPSRQDLLNITIPIIFLSVLFYLLISFTSINFSYLNFIFIGLSPILNIVIFILFECLLVSLIFYGLTKMSTS
ncbi:MAG: hypothetical protein US94_C0021G0002 [Berkelbacteria bacterium GW2011_GWB1_38_5]|uniref:Uncharacterized protein n=2 Tax=Candidatus Berkelbacteria TaxID=1618330 RepID=A0A0G0FLY6_9BACT|nr:MAG: hypothetical protein US31_C0001G0024 [Berkelbacteria bacterium GW2011_GWA1_36_9]KKQ73889.1 MAG: hypothetical protein US94_C0021G0002 [Berkelbacteria bacterium GW2011_GWB1_38_5]